MSKNQAAHHAPDEPKSRALALRAEGYSVPRIAGLVEHSERTVNRWLARGREVALNEETPEMMSDWMRIVRRSQGMQHVVLDTVEHYAEIASNDHPGPLAEIARQVATKELMKHALIYNIYAGTGSDKLQKESAPTAPAGVTVIFAFKDAPIIEGEVVE